MQFKLQPIHLPHTTLLALYARACPNNCILSFALYPIQMSKSKNHTNHNQTKKQHRNGIHKPKNHPFRSTKGMDPKFVLNQRYARKWAKVVGGRAAGEKDQ
jgi:large subunit ribosomal protein L29e